MLNLIFYCSLHVFIQFAFNALLSLYRSFTVTKERLKKQITLNSALGYAFFGTVTKTMMTAMIHPSNSDSDNQEIGSDSPPSTHFKSTISPSDNKTKYNIKHKSSIKTNFLTLIYHAKILNPYIFFSLSYFSSLPTYDYSPLI